MIPPQDPDVPVRPRRRMSIAARFWHAIGVLVVPCSS